ncbi:MAG TPA: carboxylating nicotinate-nucleotide diphosphorylase [Spirochaetia bacterium]|nr:carboxylating nicotinate-nucleotide diphosphorylase [Spirochaetia bacterium]
MNLDLRALAPLIDTCLAEDIGSGDLTTRALVVPGTQAAGRVVLREVGVVAGLPVAAEVFGRLSRDIVFRPLARDGESCPAGRVLAEIRGDAAAILGGERLALNLLQRMSGIATATARLVDRVAGCRARIVDTRKTTPGLRILEKYAVRAGGGANHRFGLFDGVLIKDNHLVLAGGVGPAVRAAQGKAPHTVRIEVEVEDLAGVEEALAAGADIILLDNMDVDTMTRAVALVGGRALTEASGGITEATVSAVASTGVDFISVGALTHSVRSLDIGLDFGRGEDFD